MAATTSRISALWAAFLNLLITCIGALGFTAPARLRAAVPVAPAAPAVPPVPAVAPSGRPVAGPPPQPPVRAGRPAVPPQAAAGRGRTAAAVPAQATASPEPRAGAPARRRSAAGDRPSAASNRRTFVPAPRPYARERSLPPTMKQRIGAEAHGASPSARSVAEPFDLPLGPPAAAAATGRAEARIPAARRRDRALCG
ncbi:DUF6344 domain-containing protein [Streptomyces sp. NPDC020983]|uniref:DUF6344 domain-containing protein n=1 Tax=Streptomyces sp. NPDC020983 TaxID=3365106 RepID=UPI0037B98B05